MTLSYRAKALILLRLRDRYNKVSQIPEVPARLLDQLVQVKM